MQGRFTLSLYSDPKIDETFTVQTNVQNQTTVTLKNLEFKDAGNRAIKATGNVDVTLDNVWVHNNQAGVSAWNGAFLNILANSVIEDNGTADSWGGGVYCNGTDSLVNLAGRLSDNKAVGGNGGNLYLASGCFVELEGGALIEGPGHLVGGNDANYGANIYVNNGGELYADGGSSRVVIKGGRAFYDGGGIYLNGTGKATLLNTSLLENTAGSEGAAIHATGGGLASAQLVMDRVADCPFIISCSEIEGNRAYSAGHVVFVDGSLIAINRTIIEKTTGSSVEDTFSSVFRVLDGSKVRLNTINMSRNQVNRLFSVDGGGTVEATHLTVADNTRRIDMNTLGDPYLGISLGTVVIENSILLETLGLDNRSGAVGAKCNLVDVAGDLPGGSYFMGTPSFFNKAGFDYRQNAHSDGVDMCLQDNFAWSTERDLGYQLRPVNEGTNPSGTPGETGGKYDGGYWESYINVAPDFYDVTVTMAGPGGAISQVISSNVVGITCPSDCFSTYEQGILVTLQAGPAPGYTVAWSGCDIDGGNLCSMTMDSNKNITATFTALPTGDEIFDDSFED